MVACKYSGVPLEREYNVVKLRVAIGYDFYRAIEGTASFEVYFTDFSVRKHKPVILSYPSNLHRNKCRPD
jgi:hypothetical protein